MGSKNLEFILDDGTVITTNQLSEQLGCSVSTAYSRLMASKDPKLVYRKVNKTHKGGRFYTLDDGTKWNAASLSEALGIPMSTAATRLSCYSDPKKVLAPKHTKTRKVEKPVAQVIKTRMFYDPDGFWKLFNRVIS